MLRFEFEFRIFWFVYPIICSYRESCLLVLWCAGGMCNMADNDDKIGRSRRPSAEDQGWSGTG
jgi:hypothetical protein